MLTDQDVRIWEKDIRRLLAAGLKISSEPEVARAIAMSYRAVYEALVDEGFTQEDALKIVAGSRVLPEMKG